MQVLASLAAHPYATLGGGAAERCLAAAMLLDDRRSDQRAPPAHACREQQLAHVCRAVSAQLASCSTTPLAVHHAARVDGPAVHHAHLLPRLLDALHPKVAALRAALAVAGAILRVHTCTSNG